MTSSHSGEAESSGQALERYILSQLQGLSLSVPEDDVEMMARFVEEEGLERDEKVQGVRGMLEGVVDGGVLPEEGVDVVLERMVDEHDRLKALEAERIAAEEAQARSPSPTAKDKDKDILATLTPEELAAAQKQALLRQYAYLDADPEDVSSLLGQGRDSSAPPRTNRAVEGDEKKAAEERRRLIEAALIRDGKKKKYRKQQEVDLLAPNLNREKVAYAAQVQREAAKRGAQEKKERDKAALDKQRADAAKAKADKQKKAAKQERRA